MTIAATTGVANSFTITLTPNQPNNAATIGANTLYLKQALTSYGVVTPVYTSFTVTVNNPACNCELLRWTLPTKASQTVNVVLAAGTATSINLVTASVVAASKGATADTAIMRKCHADGTTCSETSTFTITNKATGNAVGSSEMVFITQTGTTNEISVKAISHTSIGSFTIRVT